jgi:hypothetical protein
MCNVLPWVSCVCFCMSHLIDSSLHEGGHWSTQVEILRAVDRLTPNGDCHDGVVNWVRSWDSESNGDAARKPYSATLWSWRERCYKHDHTWGIVK